MKLVWMNIRRRKQAKILIRTELIILVACQLCVVLGKFKFPNLNYKFYGRKKRWTSLAGAIYVVVFQIAIPNNLRESSPMFGQT